MIQTTLSQIHREWSVKLAQRGSNFAEMCRKLSISKSVISRYAGNDQVVSELAAIKNLSDKVGFDTVYQSFEEAGTMNEDSSRNSRLRIFLSIEKELS